MTERDDSSSPSLRWALGLLAIAAAGGMLFWASRGGDEAMRTTTTESPADSKQAIAHDVDEPVRTTVSIPVVGAPKVVIPGEGRLSIMLDDLREGSAYVLALDMPDAARGTKPLATRIVDVERQRVIDVEGVAITGAGTGVRLEIDPEWLEPGLYMIQVKTNDETPLPVRRYVLEVR